MHVCRASAQRGHRSIRRDCVSPHNKYHILTIPFNDYMVMRMARKTAPSNDQALPVLLRVARNTYANALRGPLAEQGYDDIPRNGVFIIAALSRDQAPLAQVISWLGVSKQAAGHLVDTLVLRGYLDRAVDRADRRRLTVSLTARGRAVAAIARAAVERVDDRLAKSVSAEYIAHTRTTLMALIAIGRMIQSAPLHPQPA